MGTTRQTLRLYWEVVSKHKPSFFCGLYSHSSWHYGDRYLLALHSITSYCPPHT